MFESDVSGQSKFHFLAKTLPATSKFTTSSLHSFIEDGMFTDRTNA